jgi:hypothetical protein
MVDLRAHWQRRSDVRELSLDDKPRMSISRATSDVGQCNSSGASAVSCGQRLSGLHRAEALPVPGEASAAAELKVAFGIGLGDCNGRGARTISVFRFNRRTTSRGEDMAGGVELPKPVTRVRWRR